MADRLHLLQDHWLELVLSEHDPGRLQPLHHRLETLHKYAGWGRNRHHRTGTDGVWLRPGCSAQQATSSQRQWLQRLLELQKNFFLRQ